MDSVLLIVITHILCQPYAWYLCFPGSSSGKERNAGEPGLTPGSGRSPAKGIGFPLQYSCLENPHGQRNLVGYSPWSCKESDTIE